RLIHHTEARSSPEESHKPRHGRRKPAAPKASGAASDRSREPAPSPERCRIRGHAVAMAAIRPTGRKARLRKSPSQQTNTARAARDGERVTRPLDQSQRTRAVMQGKAASLLGRKTATAGTAGQNDVASQLARGLAPSRNKPYSGRTVAPARALAR